MKNRRPYPQPSLKPKLRAKKSLGQNFLVDQRMALRLIDLCAFDENDVVLEIGPGTGALTRLIAPRVKRLIAVETDRTLCVRLNEDFNKSNVEIIHADFLKVDFSELLKGHDGAVKVFGNLPYYISTPIITKVIENRSWVARCFVTVQLEFGERMTAVPGGKEFGALSCYVQYYTVPAMLTKIKRTSFKPVPNVDSCFMSLAMREKPVVDVPDEAAYFQLIRTAFQHRRKTVQNSLASLFSRETVVSAMERAQIKANARPETLTLEQFALLSQQIISGGK